MRDMATGRARGFAFVEMATDADAQKAITELHDKPFGGRTLTVNEARPRTERPGGFGGTDGRRRRRPWAAGASRAGRALPLTSTGGRRPAPAPRFSFPSNRPRVRLRGGPREWSRCEPSPAVLSET